jgi:hypothetical protein
LLSHILEPNTTLGSSRGRLEEAERHVQTSLLDVCRVHGDAGIGERVTMRLLVLGPAMSSSYVLLSHLHASGVRWDAWRMLKGKSGKEDRMPVQDESEAGCGCPPRHCKSREAHVGCRNKPTIGRWVLKWSVRCHKPTKGHHKRPPPVGHTPSLRCATQATCSDGHTRWGARRCRWRWQVAFTTPSRSSIAMLLPRWLRHVRLHPGTPHWATEAHDEEDVHGPSAQGWNHPRVG